MRITDRLRSCVRLATVLVLCLLYSSHTDAQVKVIEVVEIEGLGSFVFDELPAIVLANGDILVSGTAADLTNMDVTQYLRKKLEGLPADKKSKLLMGPRSIKRFVVGNSTQQLSKLYYDESMDFAIFKGNGASATTVTNFEQYPGLDGLVLKSVIKGNDFNGSKKLRFREIEIPNGSLTTKNGNIYITKDLGVSDGVIVNKCGEVVALYHHLKSGVDGYQIYTSKDLIKFSNHQYKQDLNFNLSSVSCDNQTAIVPPVDIIPDIHDSTIPADPITNPVKPNPNPVVRRRSKPTYHNPVTSEPLKDRGGSSELDSMLFEMVIQSMMARSEVKNIRTKVDETSKKIEIYLIAVCAILVIGFILMALKIRNKKGGKKVPQQSNPKLKPDHKSKTEAPIVTSKGGLKDDCGIFGGGTFLVQGTFTVGRGEGSTLK
ncbi:MAG: hypothetical protein JKY54_01450, partial [Flavobacteriales bacterium]|nr:hypothetical protein [Flavobacteriales bacterium]